MFIGYEVREMLTPLQQKRAWENMLSAEIRANYFADLSSRYRWHQRLANWITLVLSSGAFISLVLKMLKDGQESFSWLGWLPALFTLASAAVSAYSIVAQNYDRAMSGTDLHSRWNRLSKDYQSLWDDIYDEKALDRLQRLEEIGTELSKAGVAFPNRKRQMLKWQKHVEQHHATA